MLMTVVTSSQIQCSTPIYLLPSIGSVVDLADSQERAAFTMLANVKEEVMETDTLDKEEVGWGGGWYSQILCVLMVYNSGFRKISILSYQAFRHQKSLVKI